MSVRIGLTFVILICLCQFTSADGVFPYQTIHCGNQNVAQNERAHAFVKKITKIVKNKDLDSLLEIISPTFLMHSDELMGVEGFKRYWRLDDNPEKTELWTELTELLNLGAVLYKKDNKTYKNNTMVSPSCFENWPDNLDSDKYQAVIADRVNLRSAPSTKAKVIRQLSYEIILRLKDQESWQKVQTHDGKIGYINSRYIRSELDYSMIFEYKYDHWMLISMSAGD